MNASNKTLHSPELNRLGLGRKVNSHGQEPLEAVPAEDCEDIRSTGSWRNSKTPLLAVAIELENRNAPSVLYGSIVGAPYLDPSRGLQFIIEAVHCAGWDNWVEGKFKVSVEGGNLECVRNRLNAGTRAVIREHSEESDGDRVVRIGAIKVEPWAARR